MAFTSYTFCKRIPISLFPELAVSFFLSLFLTLVYLSLRFITVERMSKALKRCFIFWFSSRIKKKGICKSFLQHFYNLYGDINSHKRCAMSYHYTAAVRYTQLKMTPGNCISYRSLDKTVTMEEQLFYIE